MKSFLCKVIPFLLSSFLLFNVNAQSPYELNITASFENQTLSQIFQELDEQYPISFYYKTEWLPSETQSFQFENQPLVKVLETLLQNTNLTTTSFSNYAIIVAKSEDLSRRFSQEYYVNQYLKEISDQEEADRPQNEIVVLGDSTKNTSRSQVTIEGKITDSYNGEALAGATFYIEALNKSAISSNSGRFQLTVPFGEHTVNVRFIGYDNKDITIQALSNVEWNFPLDPEAYELSEVVITERANDSNVNALQVGVSRLSPVQIKELPAFLGEADVVKSLLTLPGVSTVGEGASGFNVRGGNIDQNLIMQDNALVFNSSHVLGFFSIFNPDAIREATLYKGHIPAQYGGRLSSVLDVKLKNADYQKFKARGGLGIVSSRLVLEVPIIEDKTSLLLGGRSSYSDWILNFVSNPAIQESSAFFYDINGKLSHRFNGRSSLALSFYRSFDDFQFTDEFGFSWSTQNLSFNFDQTWSHSLSSTLYAVMGTNENASNDPEGQDAFTLKNGMDFLKLKKNFLFQTDNHNVNFGAEWVRYEAQPERLMPRGQFSGTVPQQIEKDNGQEFGFYIDDEINLNDRISFSLGFRYSYFQQLGDATEFAYLEGQPKRLETITDTLAFNSGDVIQTYNGFEPRFSFKLGLNNSSSIKLSYNRMNQYIHLISNTSAAIPVDIWQVSNQHVAPQRSNNFSLGYFRNFNSNAWETSFEVFYKQIENLVEYKDLPTLLLNQTLETELLTGKGQAFGAELSIKKTVGRTTGWLSYTFSRAFSKVEGNTPEETINFGDWFPSNFDKPHNLNVSYNYKVSKKSKLALNFTYSTGRPVTAPVTNYFQGGAIIPHYSQRNEFRIPDYHRLDFAYTITPNVITTRRWKGSWTFSIYNLYSRRNAFSVFFRRNDQSASNAFKLAVLGSAFPAVTYNFEF